MGSLSIGTMARGGGEGVSSGGPFGCIRACSFAQAVDPASSATRATTRVRIRTALL